MTARHAEPEPPPRPHAILVAAIPSAEPQRIAAELRRDALVVEVASADVLRNPPAAAVYVFCFDAVHGLALAEPIVAWASKVDKRAGLIGVISDGEGGEREALLAAGFDDAIAGNVSTRELSARVRAVHRRVGWHGTRGRLRFGDFTLDLENHAVWTEGIAISLTPIELAVMRALIEKRGRPLSRAELLAAAWGENELDITERAVDNVILRLRRKLPRPDAIETVRSVGFRIAS